MAAIHMSTMGEEGIKEAALQCLKKTAYAKDQLKKYPKIKFPHDAPVFNEFVIDIGKNGSEIVEKIAKDGVIAGFPLVYYYPDRENQILVAFTEMNSKQDIDRLVSALGGEL
jgi:glycine dehydrogenase subunit 1